jgi:hypothetical protein
MDAPTFHTKIAVVVREDLATWQKLNVTAFLTSGIVGAADGLLGAPYEDAAGNVYHRLLVQPYTPAAMDVVGLALRDDKKIVDKITRGATLHR